MYRLKAQERHQAALLLNATSLVGAHLILANKTWDLIVLVCT